MAHINGLTHSREYSHWLLQCVRVNGNQAVLGSVGESEAHLYFYSSDNKCFAVFPRDNRPLVEVVPDV